MKNNLRIVSALSKIFAVSIFFFFCINTSYGQVGKVRKMYKSKVKDLRATHSDLTNECIEQKAALKRKIVKLETELTRAELNFQQCKKTKTNTGSSVPPQRIPCDCDEVIVNPNPGLQDAYNVLEQQLANCRNQNVQLQLDQNFIDREILNLSNQIDSLQIIVTELNTQIEALETEISDLKTLIIQLKENTIELAKYFSDDRSSVYAVYKIGNKEVREEIGGGLNQVDGITKVALKQVAYFEAKVIIAIPQELIPDEENANLREAQLEFKKGAYTKSFDISIEQFHTTGGVSYFTNTEPFKIDLLKINTENSEKAKRKKRKKENKEDAGDPLVLQKGGFYSFEMSYRGDESPFLDNKKTFSVD